MVYQVGKMPKEFLVTDEPAMTPVHPGKIIKEDVLPALGISVSKAAQQLGISRQMLQRILAETRSITPEIAVRLGKFCGNGPGIWLRLQQAYDLWKARSRLGDDIDNIPTHRFVSET